MWKRLDTATSLLFILPLVVSVYVEVWVMAYMLFVLTPVSFWYHFVKPEGFDWWWDTGRRTRHQTIALWCDTVIANAVVVYGLYIFLSKSFPLLFLPAFGAMLISLYFFLVPNSFGYERSHALWHTVMAFALGIIVLV